MVENTSTVPTNRNAVISLIAALLTLLSFCVGAAPFLPLTGYVCFPASAVLGSIALFSGFSALRQIRTSGENGRNFALIGVWMGGLSMAGLVCMIVAWITLLPFIISFIRQIPK